MMRIRLAKVDEIEWVNQRYDEVEFVHSIFDREIIAIAEIGDQKAGIGRVVKIDSKSWELGGMYVFESFRGQGIAGEIVSFLLNHLDSKVKVYCIPFQQLISFYQQYGFQECVDLSEIPEEIRKKFEWCQKKYKSPVALLALTNI